MITLQVQFFTYIGGFDLDYKLQVSGCSSIMLEMTLMDSLKVILQSGGLVFDGKCLIQIPGGIILIAITVTSMELVNTGCNCMICSYS